MELQGTPPPGGDTSTLATCPIIDPILPGYLLGWSKEPRRKNYQFFAWLVENEGTPKKQNNQKGS